MGESRRLGGCKTVTRTETDVTNNQIYSGMTGLRVSLPYDMKNFPVELVPLDSSLHRAGIWAVQEPLALVNRCPPQIQPASFTFFASLGSVQRTASIHPNTSTAKNNGKETGKLATG